MSKKGKQNGKPAAVEANKAAPVAKVEAVGKMEADAAPVAQKLTKRNATPIGALLVATDKAPKSRADHVRNAWAAVLSALPNTAAELAKLEPLADPKCVSPQAFLSYMQRRGFLTVKE